MFSYYIVLSGKICNPCINYSTELERGCLLENKSGIEHTEAGASFIIKTLSNTAANLFDLQRGRNPNVC